MAKITWTGEAERWLKNIFDYIAQDNPVAAANVIDGIYQKAQILESFPESGYRYESTTDENIRILLYGHYRIAYRVRDDKDVDVLGVFHGALEIENYLL